MSLMGFLLKNTRNRADELQRINIMVNMEKHNTKIVGIKDTIKLSSQDTTYRKKQIQLMIMIPVMTIIKYEISTSPSLR